MTRIEIQKTMLVDGKEVHVSERVPVGCFTTDREAG